MFNLAQNKAIYFDTCEDQKIICLKQIEKLSDKDKEQALKKVCDELYDDKNQNIKFSDGKVFFSDYVNRIHSIKQTKRGEAVYTLKPDDMQFDTMRFVDNFLNNPIENLIEKFKVSSIYTFEKKKEIWVVVKDINSGIILEFDDIVYEIIKGISFDLLPIIIGENQINEKNIPVYDVRIEA